MSIELNWDKLVECINSIPEPTIPKTKRINVKDLNIDEYHVAWFLEAAIPLPKYFIQAAKDIEEDFYLDIIVEEVKE